MEPTRHSPEEKPHIGLLDGWRAFSILAVLAGHLLPLGPHAWGLNGAAAASGMAVFFTLSGFLIANLLLADPRPAPFLIRRLFRIVPLAWAAMAVLAIWRTADAATISANLLFFANLPPSRLMAGGEHLWSLCVEVQFYVSIAALVLCLGRRGLYLLPVGAALVTAARIGADQPISIITWHRVDEILAGATLALIARHVPAGQPGRRLPPWATIVLTMLLFASAHEASGALQYLRPYFAAGAVGASLYGAPAAMRTLWQSRPARYVADISYALYVVHAMLAATWLGGENLSTAGKYALRPALFLAIWLLAHASTRYYEHRWIALGKRIVNARFPARPLPAPVTRGKPHPSS